MVWLSGLKSIQKCISCPVCGRTLARVDAIKLCRVFFVWCPNYRCRWSHLFVNAVGLLDSFVYYFSHGKLVNCMVELKMVGSASLAKKRDAKAEDAVGLKIYPPRDDGSPDFSKESKLIWMADLKELLSGARRFVPVYHQDIWVKPVAKLKESEVVAKDDVGAASEVLAKNEPEPSAPASV